MKSKAQAMVLASFAADSLSLPAHWIYDTAIIDQEFGSIDELMPPVASSYHSNKRRGDFTHYGDQALVLLKHLSENKEFDLNRFSSDWQQFYSSSESYKDKATQKTLAALGDGTSPDECGSGSSDLGGPARLAPLIYWYRDDPEKLLMLAHQQTRFTHTGSGIGASTEFIVQAALAVLDGQTPGVAISHLIDSGVQDLDLDMRLRRSIDTVGNDSRKVISDFGQMCSTSAALPGAVHLILTYEDDLKEALIQNVMAGGDSAARGLVVGMILGAYTGMAGIKADWLEDMRAINVIRQCLDNAR